MHARTADPKTHLQRTLPQLKNRRVAEREPMACRVIYTYQAGGSTYAVDGVTRDLCRIGCGIRGTIMPSVGGTTRLKAYLPGQKLPISLDARITWVVGDYFGVRFFPEMDKKDYTRVRQYMWSVLNRLT
jgi:PilZ domain